MLQQKEHPKIIIWLKFGFFLFSLTIIWGQGGIQSAKAATWTICQSGGCNFSSIQTAINNGSVMNGDTLSFPVNKETYNETITLSKSLTFVGQTTAINAQDGGTAVTITGNPTVDMQNMIIQNGSINNNNGGGIRLSGGNLTLTNVTLSGNDATGTGLGGGIYIASGSSATLTDVTMNLNTAVDSGGSIYNQGNLTASNLSITDNDAANGGGFYNTGTATLTNLSAARRNDATQSGGGFYNAAGAELTLINNDLSSNTAANGAAIYNAGTLQLTQTDLGSGNDAATAGGGLYNSSTGQATLSSSAVFQNQSVTGAGIYNAGMLTAANTTLSRNAGPDNQPSANGPGLYNTSGSATLNNVTIHLTIGTSIFMNGGTVTVGNSIISSVSGQVACGGSGGTAVSNGYNLAIDQSCTFLTATGDLTGINPDLNAINSPAEGAAYHAPKLTSPVLDAGNPATPGSGGTACLATDTRGLARPQNLRCDIGAMEILVYRVYAPLVIR